MEAVLDCLCSLVRSAGWGAGMSESREEYMPIKSQGKKDSNMLVAQGQAMRAPLRSVKVKETPLKLAKDQPFPLGLLTSISRK